MKLSNSQNLVIQGVLSILVAAVLTALAAGVQFVASHGFDIPTLLSLMIASFGASFGLALKNFVPQHAKDELQAYKDLTAQLQSTLHIQQTTPPVVNVQVPQQAPLQGVKQATIRPITPPQPFQLPQQSFPQTATAGTSPMIIQSSISPTTSAATVSDVTSTDTTPRVAALLAQIGQGQQNQ